MKIEHIALNVADPVRFSEWYCTHLGMKVVRHLPEPFQTHFLSDAEGETIIEIYCCPPDQVPDYPKMHPLLLHLAFVSDNPTADAARLGAVGAIHLSENLATDGTHLIMLRDPWGLAIQLCRRPVSLAETLPPN